MLLTFTGRERYEYLQASPCLGFAAEENTLWGCSEPGRRQSFFRPSPASAAGGAGTHAPLRVCHTFRHSFATQLLDAGYVWVEVLGPAGQRPRPRLGADTGKCHMGSPTWRDPGGPVADRDLTLVSVGRLYKSSYVPDCNLYNLC